MNVATHLFGLEVGSTAPVFVVVLAVHVVAGLGAAVLGTGAALTRKGRPRYVRLGRWYCRAITTVFGTAVVLTAFRPREDYELALIGLVAFVAAQLGYRRAPTGSSRHGSGRVVGMGLSYVALLTAFYVDNGPHLPLWDRLPTIAFWLLPAAVGVPLTLRAAGRSTRSLSNGHGQDAPGRAS